MKMALFKGATRLLTCLLGSTSLACSFAPPCSTLLHLPNMQRNATSVTDASILQFSNFRGRLCVSFCVVAVIFIPRIQWFA